MRLTVILVTTLGFMAGTNAGPKPDPLAVEAHVAVKVNSAMEDGNRIVGGTEVVPHSLPWQVVVRTLKWKDGRRRVGQCGGSIICPKFVLSAAHCVDEDDGVHPDNVTILAGAHNIRSFMDQGLGTDASSSRHDVLAIHNHPGFNIPTRVNNDYTVLELKQPITMRPEARAIYLPGKFDDKPFYEGSSEVKFLVSGWGRIRYNGPASDELLSVTVPSVSGKDCEKAYAKPAPDGYMYYVTKHMICAGNLNEGLIDSCQGDSGGPVALLDEKSDGKVKLIGVVSFGYECARPIYPGIYARVTSVLEWVATKTNNCNKKTCQEDNCMDKDKLIDDVLERFRTISNPNDYDYDDYDLVPPGKKSMNK